MDEQERAVGCTDGVGRRATTRLSTNDEGKVCVRTPPGESGCFDWWEVDQLVRHLIELRREMPGAPS